MESRKITLMELSELLELGTWIRGYKGYIITEDFENKDNMVYNVRDLHIELEKDLVMFYDYDGILIGSMLMIQLKESILRIHHYYNGIGLHEDIAFCTGKVYIDAIAS